MNNDGIRKGDENKRLRRELDQMTDKYEEMFDKHKKLHKESKEHLARYADLADARAGIEEIREQKRQVEYKYDRLWERQQQLQIDYDDMHERAKRYAIKNRDR